MKIQYCGPAKDYSGYGEANRHDIAALVSAGCEVTVDLTRHCLEISDFGKLGVMVDDLSQKQINYDFKILHTTPNLYGQFIEPGKYHIGRVFWETDKLPPDFAKGAQLCDEIWTGSEFNAQAIRNAGVTKPIFIIPEAIEIDSKLDEVKPFVVPYSDTFKFYSIFEWTERKNPKALIESYLREFKTTDNVSLTIKTYVDNFTPDKKNHIEKEVSTIKNKLGLEDYPSIFLMLELMNRDQIYRFHKTFDCFVSSHRGEGWGIPQMEAMTCGNPIISTNCGGIHEHLTDKEDALLVDCDLIPIKGNTRNTQWYRSDQQWADVDVKSFQSSMRWAYENKAGFDAMKQRAKETVLQKFDTIVVGQLMLDRLTAIEKMLQS